MPEDAMTADWSRQLALLCQSSIWYGAAGQERKDAFVDAMAAYRNYAALPPRLKATYKRVAREIQQAAQEAAQ